MRISEATSPNDLWVIHREEVDTVKDGVCDIYVLLDAITGHCLGMELSKDLPSSSKVLGLIKTSFHKFNARPKAIAILKADPLAEVTEAICNGLNIPFLALTKKEISPLTADFSESFKGFKRGQNPSSLENAPSETREEVEALVPHTYGPCPCASGKKFKFCCQKAFKDIVNAMCEAQEGNLEKALSYMKEAENKVGRTSEILCRYAICWSFFDRSKSGPYLKQSLELNPNHPRTNYILGIECVESKDFKKAVTYYQKAIDNYPVEDKYHLNETYNNLGTAYYELRDYKSAKESWEKALVLLPSDRVVIGNLIEFIHENPVVPEDIREVSPFIQKFLKRS